MTRVLVTRPEPGATRTVSALIAHGIDAKAIALTEISSLAFEAPKAEFEALIISSQNAIIHGAALLAQHKTKPVFAVGQRTAEILRNQEHNQVLWAENANSLMALLIAASPKRLLYICGQTRRPELEIELAIAKIQVEAVEVYSTLPNQNVSAELILFFSTSQNAIVMFHAPSAIKAFILALKNQNPPEKTHFLCMSVQIAAELPNTWRNTVSISAHADDNAMLDQLDKMLASHHLPKA